jgi:hypothetical protein
MTSFMATRSIGCGAWQRRVGRLIVWCSIHRRFRSQRNTARSAWKRIGAGWLPPRCRLVKPGGGSLGERRGLAAEIFLADGERAVRSAHRKILQSHYFPQPPDFQVSRAEPAYLKTVWLKIR